MGEIYRAFDTKLKRDVALKVLPQAFAQDPDRLARFQREAELLATLNHPNIAAIFSIEEAGGVQFFTMELVEGCTLDQMTPTGVSVAQLLDVAIRVARSARREHSRRAGPVSEGRRDRSRLFARLGWRRRRVHGTGDHRIRVRFRVETTGHGGSEAIDRARSQVRSGSHRAGRCELAVREQSRYGGAGVRASVGAQAQLRARP
jgi:hypothetical protein